ncbi:GatB/YqeY domain-containing protein [Gillisia sp. CAL575]|uniref:GatB/YqeY domain-containing protein n=1 Tax=Gillisia sp. CAL575 TaxID=985255 RepID=UPI000555E0E8|nr:GatB/YqeY domain-containing protein [Gillisia sp. CAL575]
MSLQDQVMTELKAAMRAKDAVKLEALRAIKSGILLAQTENGSKEEISEDAELKLLQKLVKQRKDSATIYKEQNREDLAQPELDQAAVIEQFLPAQLSEAEIEQKVKDIIAKTGASGMKDMGKVMGMASGELAGKADGKTISMIVKRELSNK